MENIAIILAGGSGSRFGGEIPKQFFKINGEEILKITVEKFAKRNDISKIVVVIGENWVKKAQEVLQEYKNIHIISGGNTRTQSSHNALKFIEKMGWKKAFVLIHDGARPFISNNDISNLINAGKEFQAIVLVSDATNTLYFCENNTVKEILDRSKIFEAQTPQCFNFDLISSCYKQIQNSENFTDDVSVVLKYSSKTAVKTVQATEKNTKITYKHDID